MSNFTKSILYSTTVMVVGLIGVFTIYNNMTASSDASSVANIAPAAGNSDLGVNFGEALDNADYVFEGTKSNAAEIMESSAKALNDMISAAGGQAPEIMDKTAEVADVKEEVTEASNDDTTEKVDAAADNAKETAKGSSQAVNENSEAMGENVGAIVNTTEPAAAAATSNDAVQENNSADAHDGDEKIHH